MPFIFLVFALGFGLLSASSARAQTYQFSKLAGGSGLTGSADGAGNVVRFKNSLGIAVDTNGTVYVGDSGNYTVRKILPSGAVTTLAGAAGVRDYRDGTGAAARFSLPCGVAVDSLGNVWVADRGNSVVRKITPAGEVTALAGSPGVEGSLDGTGTGARFSGVIAVAMDAAGNLFAVEDLNATVRKITAAGEVTTYAGSARQPGSADATGAAARFAGPSGIAVDRAGNVYVADTDNHTIRKITPTRAVATLAGAVGVFGAADGPGRTARFNTPRGLAVDAAGFLYVADSGNNRIRRIAPDGTVTTLAGGGTGDADGGPAVVQFNQPGGVAVDAAGNLFIADTGNQLIRAGWFFPFQINGQPQGGAFPPGGFTTLSFSVAADAPLGYRWFKNDAPLASATNSTLVLTNLDFSAAGNYRATVTNRFGATNSETVTVFVRPTNAPVVRVDGVAVADVAQFSGTARIELESAFPGGSIFFTLDGTTPDFAATRYVGPVIVSNSVVVRALGLSADFSQNVEAPPVRLATLYTVVASTPGGGAVGASPLKTQYLLNDVVQLSATINAGWTFLRWEGGASGTANPLSLSVTGAMNIQAIFATTPRTNVLGQGAVRFSRTGPVEYGATLELTAAPDLGWAFVQWGNAVSGINNPVSLVVTNPTPTVAALFARSVIGPPAFSRHPSGAALGVGASTILTVEVTGSGPFSYQWRLNGTPLANETNATLNLPRITAAHAGAYDVVVTGAGGPSVSEAARVAVTEFEMRPVVTVHGAPGTPYRVEFVDSLSATNWQTLTRAVLGTPREDLVDFTTTNRVHRFYRFVLE